MNYNINIISQEGFDLLIDLMDQAGLDLLLSTHFQRHLHGSINAQ